MILWLSRKRSSRTRSLHIDLPDAPVVMPDKATLSEDGAAALLNETRKRLAGAQAPWTGLARWLHPRVKRNGTDVVWPNSDSVTRMDSDIGFSRIRESDLEAVVRKHVESAIFPSPVSDGRKVKDG